MVIMLSSPELQSTLFDSLCCPWVTDGTAFQGFGCPSTPECHYTCASWWVRWSLFLINSRKRGEDGMVIEGTSLIVGDISPCRISVINCAGWVGNTQIRTAFIFQGQRMQRNWLWGLLLRCKTVFTKETLLLFGYFQWFGRDMCGPFVKCVSFVSTMMHWGS